MRVLDYDPFTGITTYFEHDAENKKNILKQVQNIDHIIEVNKREGELLNKKGAFWKVGTIPNVIVMQWSQECGHPPYSKEWQNYAKKQLNLPDYRKFNQNKIRLKHD